MESWPTSSERHAYAVFLLLSTYVGPIIAIIVSYALIGRSLCVGGASTSSTPSNSITARRPAASTTASRGGLGRGVAHVAHGGLPPGAGGDSWQCAPGGGGVVGGDTLMMIPSMPVPINSSRCSREAGTPAASGLQVPVRGSSSSTSSSGRKKAAAALLVAGYTAAGDGGSGGAAAANGDRGTVTIGPVVHRRHPAAARLNHVPTAGPYRDAINRSRRSVVRLLVTIVVVFVASWLPYNVVSLRVDLNLDAGEAGILPFALWLGHAHSAVNPVVYWFFNKTFRHCVRNALQWCCGLCRRSRDHLHASQYV